MNVRGIQDILEAWAPPEIAWENDNVGLQIGDSSKEVRRILVALEVSAEVASEARRKKVDLIITHHPLIFRPLRSVTRSTEAGKLIHDLLGKNVAVYAAHTNLDFTRGGVSYVLAERLGLRAIDFLQKSPGRLKKIAVFVPEQHVDKVADAMSLAGAGIIGEYEKCSFRIAGTGTFQPRKGATPFIGAVGNFETVPEVRLEMLVPERRLSPVVQSMLAAHPYEEVAYDVYPLENEQRDSGAGAVGDLPSAISLRAFLRRLKSTLKADHVRFVGDPVHLVKRIAVCGGSGASLLPDAIAAKADVFVTADVKYHTFQEAKGQIALVDAGHYETERPILDALAQHLRRAARKRAETISVTVTSTNTNPILHD